MVSEVSLSAAVIEVLVAKGLSGSDILDVARASEIDTTVDSAADKRRAWDRDRKAAKREAERLSGGMSGESPPDPAPNERDNLTPTREEKPPPKGGVKKADRGFRIPIDWEPQPITGKAAQMVACWQAGALERELAKFKNYWLSKGANAARTDWQRTWVNWLISADERTPRYERIDNPTEIAVQRLTGISSHH